MPHFSAMIGSDGPVIELTVAVGETWQWRTCGPRTLGAVTYGRAGLG